MISDAELAEMQAVSQTAMPDTCTITASGGGSFDPATGEYTSTASTIYAGACRIRQYGNAQDNVVLVGDLDAVLARYVVTLPASATGIEINHVLTVTASDDPALVGRTFNVAHVPTQSWPTDRRILVEAQTPT